MKALSQGEAGRQPARQTDRQRETKIDRYMHISICTCTCTYTHTDRHSDGENDTYIYICTYIYIHMHMCVCLHVYVCICIMYIFAIRKYGLMHLASTLHAPCFDGRSPRTQRNVGGAVVSIRSREEFWHLYLPRPGSNEFIRLFGLVAVILLCRGE